MTEPDVAWTDFALAAECAVLAARFPRRKVPDLAQRCGWRLLFAAVGIAALTGGFYHGFLLGVTFRVESAVWLVIFAAAGLAALAGWGIAWTYLASPRRARDANLVGGVLFLVYLALALVRIRSFVSVLVATGVAGALLLAAYWSSYRRGNPHAVIGIAGVLLILVGSLVQKSGFDISERFTADALYHVIVGVALFLIYVSAPAVARNPHHPKSGAPAV